MTKNDPPSRRHRVTAVERKRPAPCTGFGLRDGESLPPPQRADDPRKARDLSAMAGWAPTAALVDAAISYIDASGNAEALDALLATRVGRPRALSSRVWLLGFYLNSMRKGHTGCGVDAARALFSLPEPLKHGLGVPDVQLLRLYHRLDAWFCDVATRLTPTDQEWHDTPTLSPAGLDAFTVCQQIVRSPLTSTYLTWPSIAVDGTDFPTFGNMHVRKDRIPLDGEAIYEENGHQFGGDAGPPPWAADAEEYADKGARIFGYGVDERRIYTKDTEARAAYRTATSKGRGDVYVGHEITSAVAMRELLWTNQVTAVTVGPLPPPIFLGFNLTPGGTHRGHATLAVVRYLDDQSHLLEVAADRGITPMTGYLEELLMRGIKSVHTLTETERRIRPGPDGGVFVDGTLLSEATPTELLAPLPLPPAHASADARAPFEEAFNARAAYRWRTHSLPNDAAHWRLACPICTAHTLRCRAVGASMRASQHRPLVALPEGRTTCCSTGTVTFGPSDYPLWMQDVVPFTTAHAFSYGRRNAAETGNSLLHGGYVDLNENWAQPFGTVKRALLVAFAMAGINHHLLSP